MSLHRVLNRLEKMLKHHEDGARDMDPPTAEAYRVLAGHLREDVASVESALKFIRGDADAAKELAGIAASERERVSLRAKLAATEQERDEARALFREAETKRSRAVVECALATEERDAERARADALERDALAGQLAALREAAMPHAQAEYASDAETRTLRIVLADTAAAAEAHDREVRAMALEDAAAQAVALADGARASRAVVWLACEQMLRTRASEIRGGLLRRDRPRFREVKRDR